MGAHAFYMPAVYSQSDKRLGPKKSARTASRCRHLSDDQSDQRGE